MPGVKQTSRPYVGDIMYQCNLQPFDFRHTFAVVVTGAVWNPCGHMLLNTGGGWYFHVAERKGNPRFMRESGYERYLAEHAKSEVRRVFVNIPDPAAAHLKLEQLLASQWSWYILPNNCASFLEDVVRAGGSSAGLYSNCPTGERFK